MSTFLMLIAALALETGLAFVPLAEAAHLWDWHYRSAGLSASGTFITEETLNSAGFYTVTGITGSRNGIAIAGLQSTGTPIPGNEPYPVDNLIRAGSPQLTGDGFGFALADGTFANAFFGGSHTPQTYMEFFSSPAGKAGGGARQSESPVVFSAEERH